MSTPTDFTKMLPGFDFLQGLMKNASAGLPGMTPWIAPTLDPEELDKRIGELRTVQFWLEQNARLLGATVQALEVQRLTLSTLKTMNLPLADISESLRIKLPDPPVVAPAPAPAPAPKPAPEPLAAAAAPEAPAAPAPAPAVVDPMAWWGALTNQFTELAAQAMKDVRADAAATATRPAAGEPAAAAPRATPAAAGKAPRHPARKTAKSVAGTAARKSAARKKAAPAAGG